MGGLCGGDWLQDILLKLFAILLCIKVVDGLSGRVFQHLI